MTCSNTHRLVSVLALVAMPGCSLLVDPHSRNTYDLADAGLSANDADADAPDANHDGATTDGGVPAPTTPVLRFPWNGFMTGSAHTGKLAPPRNALRPRFVWEAASGAERYEIQLDWHCEASTRQTCAFASPLNATTTSTEWRPDGALDVSTTAPVGRRYYWRVRSCYDDQCSEWSEVRYLDVGRQVGDLNGDGYADIATTGRSAEGVGQIHIHFGPDLVTSRTLRADGVAPGGYAEVALVGDVNGDGFPDLLTADSSGACVVTGTADIVAGCRRSTVLPRPAGLDVFESGPRGGGGDVNGDGLADMLFGAPGENDDHGRADLLLGATLIEASPHEGTFVSPSPSATLKTSFGMLLSIAGDYNGDGLCDLAIGSPYESGATVEGAGRVHLYLGANPEVATAPFRSGPSPTPEHFGGYGLPTLAGDFDGDGFADLAIVAFGEESEQGRIYSAHGSRGADLGITSLIATNPTPNPFRDREGWESVRLAANGDVDGDGFSDLVVGAAGRSATDPGAVFMLRGSETGLLADAVHATRGTAWPQTFGSDLAAIGDLDGSGRAVVAVTGAGRIFVLHAESGSLAVRQELTTPDASASAYGTVVAGLR